MVLKKAVKDKSIKSGLRAAQPKHSLCTLTWQSIHNPLVDEAECLNTKLPEQIFFLKSGTHKIVPNHTFVIVKFSCLKKYSYFYLTNKAHFYGLYLCLTKVPWSQEQFFL